MKIKAVSGLSMSVKNLKKTIRFYEDLSFEFRKQDATHATLYQTGSGSIVYSLAKTVVPMLQVVPMFSPTSAWIMSTPFIIISWRKRSKLLPNHKSTIGAIANS